MLGGIGNDYRRIDKSIWNRSRVSSIFALSFKTIDITIMQSTNNNVELSSYELQALNFCTSTNTVITATYNRTGLYFDVDKESRDIYSVTIRTPRGYMSFEFGQCIADRHGYTVSDVYNGGNTPTQNRKYSLNGLYKFASRLEAMRYKAFNNRIVEVLKIAPSNYDILSCLTKHDPISLDSFCSEFGYDTDSIKANKLYNVVVTEYLGIVRCFTSDQIEQLQEIQ